MRSPSKAEKIFVRLRNPVGITIGHVSGVLLLYKKRFGCAKIAEKMGLTVRRVKTILRYGNVPLRPRGYNWAKDDYRRKVLHDLRALPVGRAGYNAVYGVYKNIAKKRGRAWGLSKQRFGILVQSACHYCGSLPIDGSIFSWAHRGRPHTGNFYYNGIDRKDSRKGYTVQNTVSCCAICNRAKSDLSLYRFKKWIRNFIAFQERKTA